jgi:hypothetical protein
MKPFTTIAVLVFTLVALLQLVRVIMGWDVVINGFHVPLWGSIVAFLLATLLAVMVWRENRRA